MRKTALDGSKYFFSNNIIYKVAFKAHPHFVPAGKFYGGGSGAFSFGCSNITEPSVISSRQLSDSKIAAAAGNVDQLIFMLQNSALVPVEIMVRGMIGRGIRRIALNFGTACIKHG
jgi:hypothetical protein